MRAISVLVVLSIASAGCAAETVERFVTISNGEIVGRFVQRRVGADLDVDIRYDENGRGAKVRERIRRGADGLPRHWEVRGVSWVGAPVDEVFDWNGSRAQWKSLNDAGSADGKLAHAYIANDSQFQAATLLPALLAAHGRDVPAWPSGKLRAQRMRDAEVAHGGHRHPVVVWVVTGLDIVPQFVMTDRGGHFRGTLYPGWITIPESWAESAGEFDALAVAIEDEAVAALARRVLHRWDAPIYLEHVRVLDPETGTRSEPTTVVCFRGHIAEIRADAVPSSDAVVIDGQGGTVMPGLFDVHAHIGSWDGPLDLAAGVTSVRDMGNINLRLLALAAAFDRGEFAGPRVVRSGFLEGRSPYSARDGFVVDNLADGLDKLHWYADRGYWMLKIYNSVTPDWVAPLAQEAHRLGMRVAGHVPAFMSSERAIRDGYDEVTHINQLLLSLIIDPEKDDTRTPFRFTALGERLGKLDLEGREFRGLVQLMQQRGTALDPTLQYFYHMLISRPGTTAVTDAPWLDHVPPVIQRLRRAPVLDMKLGQDGEYRASAQKLLDAVKALHDAAITILPGTDDNPAGLVLHSELETWQRAGIPAAEIVKIATIGCARYFKVDQTYGKIERGKRADLMLVPDDPTADVAALRQVRLVMKDGMVVFPDEVHREYGIEPFATRPPVHLPAGVPAH